MYTKYFPPQYSGAAKQAISLSKYLRKLGHQIEFVTFRWSGLKKFDVYDGFPVYRLGCKDLHVKRNEMLLWFNLFILILKNKYDIIHSHGAYYTNCIIGPIAKILNKRSIVKATLSNNDLYDLKKGYSGNIHYYCLKMIDACIAISQDLESEFYSAGISSDKVRLMPNGVDTVRFRPAFNREREKIRFKMGLPGKRLLFLTVGVFDERKNLGWLLQQWVKNNGFRTNGYLLAVGPQSREDKDGNHIRSLKKLENRNKDKIRIMDHVENIEDIYRAADAFLLPSKSEGLPNVVLEAIASGLPTIATNISGSNDIIKQDITGFLFRPNDVNSLQDALWKFVTSDRNELRNNARKVANNSYSLELMSLKYEAIYNKILR